MERTDEDLEKTRLRCGEETSEDDAALGPDSPFHPQMTELFKCLDKAEGAVCPQDTQVPTELREGTASLLTWELANHTQPSRTPERAAEPVPSQCQSLASVSSFAQGGSHSSSKLML